MQQAFTFLVLPNFNSEFSITLFTILTMNRKTGCGDAKAVLKFAKLNTAAQQRGAIAQGRSLPPIPAPV
ncbi:MAG: hypothetical protein LBK06_03455 [Planctomycetaceae bacterium]|nr:hypothetical protein [Planctomycetaceae bacterium]